MLLFLLLCPWAKFFTCIPPNTSCPNCICHVSKQCKKAECLKLNRPKINLSVPFLSSTSLYFAINPISILQVNFDSYLSKSRHTNNTYCPCIMTSPTRLYGQEEISKEVQNYDANIVTYLLIKKVLFLLKLYFMFQCIRPSVYVSSLITVSKSSLESNQRFFLGIQFYGAKDQVAGFNGVLCFCDDEHFVTMNRRLTGNGHLTQSHRSILWGTLKSSKIHKTNVVTIAATEMNLKYSYVVTQVEHASTSTHMYAINEHICKRKVGVSRSTCTLSETKIKNMRIKI